MPTTARRRCPGRAEWTERKSGCGEFSAGRIDPDLADWIAGVKARVAGEEVAALIVDVEREGPRLDALAWYFIDGERTRRGERARSPLGVVRK
jgi:hypothetical protein